MAKVVKIWFLVRFPAFILALYCGMATAQDVPKLGHAFERHKEAHHTAYRALNALNVRSIETNREFCGYIYRNDDGRVWASKPRKGGSHSCTTNAPERGVEIVASYHTHAAYDVSSLNEYPSDIDLRSDFVSGINGYIATPGGRLWFVDAEKRVARQLCGYRCLSWDRRYREAATERPKQVVTLSVITKLLDGW